MAENVSLMPPSRIDRNPENPRLIFRQDELDELQDSIRLQGILVPLTVYRDGHRFCLLDGERRWRCARKLGLDHVPIIVQPKPDKMTNIMMMFAIHNARKDWDPLPTALKLEELEREFERRNERKPTEAELTGISSLSRGTVRRLKKLLALPTKYRRLLIDELKKPRSQQTLTVDHVLEATKGAEALQKRDIIDTDEEDTLRDAIIKKFRIKIIKSTVDPRKLVRLARAVKRAEVSRPIAEKSVLRLIQDPNYSIDDVFNDTVAQADYSHATGQIAKRLTDRLAEQVRRHYDASDALKAELAKLLEKLKEFLRK